MHKTKMLVLPLLLTGLVTSCFDDEYDLDDVDYTVGAETDLTLPAFSTDTIYLHNFMDLEDDGVIQYLYDAQKEDYLFCVRENGTADVDPVSIDEIRIREPKLHGFESEVNLRQAIFGSKRRKVSIHTPMGDVEIPNQEFHYDLTDENTKYEIEEATATGISADIIGIERVGFSTIIATLDLKVSIDRLYTFINKVHLDDMVLSFPEGMELETSKCTFNGKPCSMVDSRDAIRLTPERDDEGVYITEGLELKVAFKGMDEGESFKFDGMRHTASFCGIFSLNGSIRLTTDEIDVEKLKDNQEKLEEFIKSGDPKVLVPPSVGVKGDASMNGDIVLNKFSGTVRHDVGDIKPIRLDDLPDFLNDEDVTLDISGPMLLLNIDNGLPAEITTSLSLESSTQGVAPVKTSPITVQHGHTPFLLYDGQAGGIFSERADRLPVPDNADYVGSRIVSHSGKVEDLLKDIPEQINVKVDPCTLVATDFDLTKSYDIDINYDVYAPLTFGPGFKMAYEDTETGLAEDLDDIKDMDFGRIELAGLIDNNLPAGLKFTVDFTDTEGNVIPQLKAEGIDIRGNEKNQRFGISIKAVDGHTINDALAGKNGVHKIDGIRYRAELNGEEGKTLYKKANIKIHDIKASLKGKMTIDLN